MNRLFFDKINDNPIIASVGNIDNIDDAIESPCEIIFLLSGNIFNLHDAVGKIKKTTKSVFIHFDLLEGFSRDITALRYINEHIKPDGIITTKSSLIRHAKDMGLVTIQRLFLLDSLSLQTGINSIKVTRPHAVEIMPGVMPKAIEIIHKRTRTPIITGGLIMDKEDVIKSLRAGAIGISTSKQEIWSM